MKKDQCEFFSSLRHLMRLCRWVGFFPIEGLNDLTPRRTRFNLKSIYSFYYVTSTFGVFLSTVMAFYELFAKGLSLAYIENSIFYLVALTTISLLVRLGKNWSTLIKAAMDTERELSGIRKTKNAYKICRILSYTLGILAIMEHVLYTLFNIKLVNCSEDIILDLDAVEKFFKYRLSYIFDIIPYNIWMGLLSEFICMQAAILWSFTDVMIMCFSLYLTSYFQDLGKAINSNKSKDWSQLRRYYSRLVVFLNQINSQLACFILLSAFCNLFFICVHLYKSLSKRTLGVSKVCGHMSDEKERILYLDHLIYYVYSFLFIVVRAQLMLYLAANVHRAANSAVLIMYEVPPSEYNLEVQRFQLQVRYTKVGLSGLFFNIDRPLLLRVIGTIITYELVMLQFSR